MLFSSLNNLTRWLILTGLISGNFIFFNSCNLYYNAFYTDPNRCIVDCSLKKPYDVVIIPGYPYDSLGSNPILQQRIMWAYFLYHNGYAKKIIFSGSAVHSPFVEAEIMRHYATQIGIKESDILLETRAEHTTENLFYSYMLAKEKGLNKIGFASHVAQTSFMKPFKRKFKLDVDFIPIVEDSLKNIVAGFTAVNPSTAFQRDFIPLKKREGSLKTWSGTRGRKVKLEIWKLKKLQKQI